MRISHVIDSMEVGGAERVVALLCRAQRERGHEPSVHCLYRVGPLGEELRADGFEIVLHRPTSAIGLMSSLFRQFRSSKPDVVHCHNATAAILAAPPARLANARRVIATRHGLVEPPYALRRELKFALASRFCHSIVAVCQCAASNLKKAPFACQSRIVCVRNGSPDLPDDAKIESKSGFTLLNVGRLSQAKDQATLLRAFSIARQKIENLRLWIVGDGPLRSRLEELARQLQIDDCTHFYGEQSEVARFYRAADLLVMSSVTEGLPMVLLEAMSAGLPVVVTDVGGMAEAVKLSGAGTIVRPSAPDQLAMSIEEMASDSARCNNMRTAARACYLQKFTTEKMVSEYLRLYSS